MSLIDTIYDNVYNYIEDGNSDSDDLYHTISSCFQNSIVYSWSMSDIESIIKKVNGTLDIPTFKAKRKVIQSISSRFPSRKYPATEEDVMQLISMYLDEGELEFVNQNKIVVSKGKLQVKISFTTNTNIIEMQGEIYDICERYGIETKFAKHQNGSRIIIDFILEGETSGLLSIKGLLDRQLKAGAVIIPKAKEKDAKETSKKETSPKEKKPYSGSKTAIF